MEAKNSDKIVSISSIATTTAYGMLLMARSLYSLYGKDSLPYALSYKP